MFKLIKKSKKSKARLTKLITLHGDIMGPFFMPIASKGAVKNLTMEELKNLGSQIVLANTYHLMINPGEKLIKKAGGLHKFMTWSGPILTDSGGFQVFSLANLRKVTENGVTFADPASGKKYLLTPEISIQIQKDLDVDIAMALDDVIGYPAAKNKVKEAMERTNRWAKRCQSVNRNGKRLAVNGKPLLFGIIQGGIYKDLRLQSAKDLVALDFDGYAVGGVAVGEPREKMKQVLSWVIPYLPENKPRYLMGVGKPEEIVQAVKQGIDMFDCVIPTREARHGRLYLWSDYLSLRGGPRPNVSERRGPTKQSDAKRHPEGTEGSALPRGLLRPHFVRARNDNWYTTINITNAKFARDLSPINQTNLKQYSKAYLHHLFRTNEPLAMRLATLNNLEFYLGLMQRIRDSIKKGIL